MRPASPFANRIEGCRLGIALSGRAVSKGQMYGRDANDMSQVPPSDTRQMTKTASKIHFKAKLFRPAESAKAGSWTFLIVPKNASAKLPSRGRTAIEGTINGSPFQAVLDLGGKELPFRRRGRGRRPLKMRAWRTSLSTTMRSIRVCCGFR